MKHLTVRVPWHDNRWNGTVCNYPSQNSFCVALDRIRAERDDPSEELLAGRSWSDLNPEQLPPCKAESGIFMNDQVWIRRLDHPYKDIPKASETHGHLRPILVKVPEYSTFAVPFAWMLRENQQEICDHFPHPLPPDEDPPFNSSWVFGRERQEALLKIFFNQLEAKKSLMFFYTKEGHPLGESIRRLVVGVGTIQRIGPTLYYGLLAVSCG